MVIYHVFLHIDQVDHDGKVILENFEDYKDGQLWKKGELNAEGYFTLKNDKVSKFLTAHSSANLELKGNITQGLLYRWTEHLILPM